MAIFKDSKISRHSLLDSGVLINWLNIHLRNDYAGIIRILNLCLSGDKAAEILIGTAVYMVKDNLVKAIGVLENLLRIFASREDQKECFVEYLKTLLQVAKTPEELNLLFKTAKERFVQHHKAVIEAFVLRADEILP